MPYFETIQEWTRESSLLLKARPTTTRITTKYTLHPKLHKPTSTQQQKRSKKRKIEEAGEAGKTSSTSAAAAAPPTETAIANTSSSSSSSDPPKASLTLKTYDPVSGACLKYRTFRAAEVGRLIGGLGELGRGMAGLTDSVVEGRDDGKDEEKKGADERKGENEDHAMPDAPAAAVLSTVKSARVAGASANPSTSAKPMDKTGQSGGTGGSTGGKKKKKGKK